MSKQVTGLASGQVTTWTSWHRWTDIVPATPARQTTKPSGLGS
jgi:hypothetical protein